MNIIIEEVVSEFPVLITEEVFQITISDAVSYFDIIEVADTSFVGKDGYVPVVNEATGKLVLTEQQSGPGGGLTLGETSTTAYRGDRGKTAYDHSQDVTTNPHNVTKSQVGLGSVDNTSDVNKPISNATQIALDNKVDKIIGKGLSEEDYTTVEKSKLSSITEIFTTALKTTYDDASAWVTDIGLQLKTDFDALVATGSRLITSTEITKLSNTSGTNSGDNATNTTSNSYADTKVASELASFKNDNFLDFTSSGQTQLDGKQNTLGFTSYASGTTTVGWSSFTQKVLWYIDFNTHYLFFYHLEGPGNGINSSFTIPYTATENSTSQHIVMSNGSYFNNPGRGSIANGSNVVNLFATIPGSTWSAGASNKIASGFILIKK